MKYLKENTTVNRVLRALIVLFLVATFWIWVPALVLLIILVYVFYFIGWLLEAPIRWILYGEWEHIIFEEW